MIDRTERSWAARGFALYAVTSREAGELLGFCGLSHHRALPDEVEVGWRLARHAWGRGVRRKRPWYVAIWGSTCSAGTG
jgi:RimJ/RimL family protein N-acetyltransferase